MSRAIYVRTSTDDNDGAAQLHQLRTWCAAQGWKGVKEYVDRGECGAKDSRPEWNKLHAAIAKGGVTELAATELCRLGRSAVSVLLALDEIYRRGCRVVLLREGLDYATPVGRLVATILAAVAQLERDQIRARIISGVNRAKELGTRSGKAIGRPRAQVTEMDLEKVRHARALGGSWAEVARAVGKPASTLRRAHEACQNLREDSDNTGT
jgi:DNA invertase Pin-like site-specific DNA recombinase